MAEEEEKEEVEDRLFFTRYPFSAKWIAKISLRMSLLPHLIRYLAGNGIFYYYFQALI